jgi:protein-disulfide isomerase
VERVDLANDVDPRRDHIRGAPDAPVTLVEYGDFQCLYCQQAESVVRKLLQGFSDDLRLVWRHLPSPHVHPDARLAAEAAEAAGVQGAFWELHDTLLAHQQELRPLDLARYAKDLELDIESFREALTRRRYAERVADDIATAEASGVTGTPTFFINGKRHHGAYDADTLASALRDAGARGR